MDTNIKFNTVQYIEFCKGNFIFNSGLRIFAMDNNSSLIPAQPGLEDEKEHNFTVLGRISLPHKKGSSLFPIKILVTIQFEKNDSFIITQLKGKASAPEWEMAKGINLSDLTITLICPFDQPSIQFHSILQHTTSPGVSLKGMLDCSLVYDPENPEHVSIETELSKSTVIFENQTLVSNSPIHFVFLPQEDTKVRVQDLLEHDGNTACIKTNEPISFGSMLIKGIDDEPFSIAFLLKVVHKQSIKTYVSILGAQIKPTILGDETILFIHDEQYENPCIIDLTGEWNGCISSNVCIHLLNPSDIQGSALILGTAFLAGSVKGRGLVIDEIKLQAELSGGEVFPESTIPQEIPNQDICLRITDTKTDFSLLMHPLTLGMFTIHPGDDTNKYLRTSLSPKGMQFPPNLILTIEHGKGRKLTLQSFVTDGFGNFYADCVDQKLEVGDSCLLEAERIRFYCNKGSSALEFLNPLLSLFPQSKDSSPFSIGKKASLQEHQNTLILSCDKGSFTLHELSQIPRE